MRILPALLTLATLALAVVGREEAHRLRRDVVNGLVHGEGVALEEVVGEQGDVVPSLAQWRHDELDHVQAEVEVHAELAELDLPQQVVRAVHMQWRQGIGEARLQLHPQHLGHLTVLLRVEGGTVTAVLRTESRLALERIEANQQELRAALEQQGLRLDRLVVAVDPDARGRRQPSAPPFAGRHYSRPTDGQPLFDLNDVASE